MPRWIALLTFSFALAPLVHAAPSTLTPLLRQAREAQSLVSAFDRKLETITSEDSLDRLLASGLYCRIQAARAAHDSLEAKLQNLMRQAFQMRSETRLLGEIYAFSRTDAASAAAAGQILKQLALDEAGICGAPECMSSVIEKGNELPFSPLDDQDFGAYLEENRAAIATKLSAKDELPGECFGSPDARASYDWSKRNWISSNLNNGEFVVTYDDGPHAANTEQLMQIWMGTNYPRPSFFWLSENALRLKSIVQLAHERDFPVNCHSERHADLGNLAKAASAAKLSSVNRETFGPELKNVSAAEFPAWKQKTLDREISGAAHGIEAVVHEVDPAYRVKRFRLPFGSGLKNAEIGRRFEALDMDHFFWRVDSLDWQDKNSASVLKRVTKEMTAGKRGVILFHDIQAPTVNTTKLLIDTFDKTAGWKPVSIRQMVP